MEMQFAAQAYQARSTQLLAQQCINAFVEPTPKEAKTQAPVYGIPGLALWARLGNGPINGLHVMAENLCVLSGAQLYTIAYTDVLITAAGSPVPSTLIGTTTLGGLVSMADNVQQLVMVDGSSGWVYQPGGLNLVSTTTAAVGAQSILANITGQVTSGDTLLIPLDNGATFTAIASANADAFTGTLSFSGHPLPGQVSAGAAIVDPVNVLGEIFAAAFQPTKTVRYFDGYFVFSANGTREFFLSGLNDGTQYSGLDFATASANSDFIQAVEVYHEQLLLMMETDIEVWWDAGNVSFPFQRYDAALVARGLAAPFATCSEDNTVFWLADDGIFYRLEGFLPKRVSTFAMEHAWAAYPLRFTDASCFVLDQEGHKFVVVNFASGNQTWCYDISTGLWHQRESWGTPWV